MIASLRCLDTARWWSSAAKWAVRRRANSSRAVVSRRHRSDSVRLSTVPVPRGTARPTSGSARRCPSTPSSWRCARPPRPALPWPQGPWRPGRPSRRRAMPGGAGRRSPRRPAARPARQDRRRRPPCPATRVAGGRSRRPRRVGPGHLQPTLEQADLGGQSPRTGGRSEPGLLRRCRRARTRPRVHPLTSVRRRAVVRVPHPMGLGPGSTGAHRRCVRPRDARVVACASQSWCSRRSILGRVPFLQASGPKWDRRGTSVRSWPAGCDPAR